MGQSTLLNDVDIECLESFALLLEAQMELIPVMIVVVTCLCPSRTANCSFWVLAEINACCKIHFL